MWQNKAQETEYESNGIIKAKEFVFPPTDKKKTRSDAMCANEWGNVSLERKQMRASSTQCFHSPYSECEQIA